MEDSLGMDNKTPHKGLLGFQKKDEYQKDFSFVTNAIIEFAKIQNTYSSERPKIIMTT